jgi:hypothetical protein
VARGEREERAPRPEREHPIGVELYDINRNGWGFLHQARSMGMDIEPAKVKLCERLDALKAKIMAF